jgi:hypothetical protein
MEFLDDYAARWKKQTTTSRLAQEQITHQCVQPIKAASKSFVFGRQWIMGIGERAFQLSIGIV